MSEAELVRRLGQPDASSGNMSQQFEVFNNIDARYVNPSAGYHYDHDYHYGSGRPQAIAEFNCKTTFVIENGRVRAYDLTGNGCRRKRIARSSTLVRFPMVKAIVGKACNAFGDAF